MNLPHTRLSEPMAPDRWHHIQQILADAIECPAGEREALVDARCANDSWLKREVASLLVAHDADGVVDRLGPLLHLQASAGLKASWSGAGGLSAITVSKHPSAGAECRLSTRLATSGVDARSP